MPQKWQIFTTEELRVKVGEKEGKKSAAVGRCDLNLELERE